MKLIILTTLVLKHAEYITANQHYGFHPQFQKPNSGVFASDSSIYLPPESHTPVPYFPIKSSNNLPFPYLPPTGTKAPSIYPSPFPVILSSTLVPIFDEDDEKEHEERNKLRISSTPPPMSQMKRNVTDNSPQTQQSQQAQRREMRQVPKMPNYHNPIDRIDMRFPVRDFPQGPSTPNPINQTPRNMIISVDTHRNDRGIDQIRAASLSNQNYIPAQGFSFSSTTEPAIPILRLSNEMDLDGSFSYEALGADQTHYVQHSHMENMGTEKEEQVVEGSYSYVGDNGQTYTVHYIADSNGFRASGDHLPVAPPIPEIIQRAVQYNLAEEAKKPPHLRSWQDEKEYDNSIDKSHNFAPPPPRNLFTGRTPEAFSYNFGQGSNDNNLAVAASSQVPVKTKSEFNIDQSRKPNGPISPQITFAASQGAHVPSLNNAQQQQSISRIFSNEKAMPQLINYDAGIKEAEQEANKGLWRWQYGLNSNNANQAPDKNTISRSFGEDDIMINFNEMTPDQYTKMLQSQIEPNAKDSSASSQYSYNQQNNQIPINQPTNQMNQYQNSNENDYYSANYNSQPSLSTEASSTFSYSTRYPENSFTKESSTVSQSTSNNFNQNNYVSPKPLVTYSYDYNDSPDNIYEPRRIKALHVDTTTKPSFNMNSISVPNQEQRVSYNNIWSNAKDLQQHLQNEPKLLTQVPQYNNPSAAPQNLEDYEQKSEFKPMKPLEEYPQTTTTTTTTTAAPLKSTTEDIFKTNMFLKGLIAPKKSEHKNLNQITEEPKKVVHNKIVAETKADKIPKLIQYQPKPHNELKSLKNKKPMDLSDMINYINMKNYFESSKVKTKSNSFGYGNHDNRNEMRYLPVQYDQDDEQDDDYNVPQLKNNMRSVNSQEQDELRNLNQLRNNLHSINQNEELRGVIKNYKVLQRNNHARHTDPNYQSRKEFILSPIKTLQSGLPPLGRAGPSMKTYLPPTYI